MTALLDMSPALDLLATNTYTITRRTPGTVDPDTGLSSAATSSTLSVRATVLPEPSLADDEQRHRAGAWSTDRIMVWAKLDDLGAGGALTATTSDRLADRISYQGKTYEVTDSLDWGEPGGYSQARFGIVDLSVEG